MALNSSGSMRSNSIPVQDYKTLLTVWKKRFRVHLEKLMVMQLVKKFHTLYGTKRFNTAFITAHLRGYVIWWFFMVRSC
jgi:hypothetical protein